MQNEDTATAQSIISFLERAGDDDEANQLGILEALEPLGQSENLSLLEQLPELERSVLSFMTSIRDWWLTRSIPASAGAKLPVTPARAASLLLELMGGARGPGDKGPGPAACDWALVGVLAQRAESQLTAAQARAIESAALR